MRIYGKQSLFDAVITRMGLSNAWQEETNYWGFSAIGIERLAKYHDAQLVIVEPLPVGVLKQLSQSKIWSALPVVQQKKLCLFTAGMELWWYCLCAPFCI